MADSSSVVSWLGEGQGGRLVVGLVTHPLDKLTLSTVPTSQDRRQLALRLEVALSLMLLGFGRAEALGDQEPEADDGHNNNNPARSGKEFQAH